MVMLFIVSYMAFKWVEEGAKQGPRLVEVKQVERRVTKPPSCEWVCKRMPDALVDKPQGSVPRVTTCYYPALCTLEDHVLEFPVTDALMEFELKP
jgi:hypothetical protein